ncbi:hypothetical protein D3C84_929980 [compost metagenome]
MPSGQQVMKLISSSPGKWPAPSMSNTPPNSSLVMSGPFRFFLGSVMSDPTDLNDIHVDGHILYSPFHEQRNLLSIIPSSSRQAPEECTYSPDLVRVEVLWNIACRRPCDALE